MSELYRIAREVTDEVLGEGAYAEANRGNPDPSIREEVRRSETQRRTGGAHAASLRPARTCHYCSGLIPEGEKAMRSKTGDAWAHFECWYDGGPVTPARGR